MLSGKALFSLSYNVTKGEKTGRIYDNLFTSNRHLMCALIRHTIFNPNDIFRDIQATLEQMETAS